MSKRMLTLLVCACASVSLSADLNASSLESFGKDYAAYIARTDISPTQRAQAEEIKRKIDEAVAADKDYETKGKEEQKAANDAVSAVDDQQDSILEATGPFLAIVGKDDSITDVKLVKNTQMSYRQTQRFFNPAYNKKVCEGVCKLLSMTKHPERYEAMKKAAEGYEANSKRADELTATWTKRSKQHTESAQQLMVLLNAFTDLERGLEPGTTKLPPMKVDVKKPVRVM